MGNGDRRREPNAEFDEAVEKLDETEDVRSSDEGTKCSFLDRRDSHGK